MSQAGSHTNHSGHSNHSGLRSLLLVVLAYLLFRWSFAVLQLPAATPAIVIALAGIVTAFAAIGLPILGMVRLSERNPTLLLLLGLAAVGAAAWLGLATVNLRLPALQQAVAAVQDLGKITAASCVGMMLGSLLREPNILLPAGCFAAFADWVVVNFGTVKHALSTERGQQMVKAVSANVPAVHASLPVLTIGPADFLFLGIFLSTARKFGFDVRLNVIVLTTVLALSLAVVALVGLPIPALAPMSIAFLALNWTRFKLTRQELIGTAVVLLAAGSLFLGYFLFLFPSGARR